MGYNFIDAEHGCADGKENSTYPSARRAGHGCRGKLRATRSALDSADELNLDFDGMCAVIVALTRQDFYKSMTTYHDHTVWQDVYRPMIKGIRFYMKVTVLDDVLIVSFKEK